jgi:hypothetical protein
MVLNQTPSVSPLSGVRTLEDELTKLEHHHCVQDRRSVLNSHSAVLTPERGETEGVSLNEHNILLAKSPLAFAVGLVR